MPPPLLCAAGKEPFCQGVCVFGGSFSNSSFPAGTKGTRHRRSCCRLPPGALRAAGVELQSFPGPIYSTHQGLEMATGGFQPSNFRKEWKVEKGK